MDPEKHRMIQERFRDRIKRQSEKQAAAGITEGELSYATQEAMMKDFGLDPYDVVNWGVTLDKGEN